MSKPAFVVKLADLERGEKVLEGPIGEAWLKAALEGTSAVPRGGDGRLSVALTKTGREVMVRGEAEVNVTVPCVVTLDPLPITLRPEIFLLLRPDPAAADGKRRSGEASARKRSVGAEPAEPAADKAKKKRKKPVEEPELLPEEVAADTYRGEEIVLDDFVREFILLEIPPYPRRSDLPSSEESLSSRPLGAPPAEKAIDPRLAPLLDLQARLRVK